MEPAGDEEYYMESWLNKLKDVTIASQTVQLEEEELKLIVAVNAVLVAAYFKQLQAHNKKGVAGGEEDYVPLGQGNWLHRPEVAGIIQASSATYNGLTGKLSALMEPNHRYFGKLSLRSAKDSLAIKKTQRRYDQELLKLGCTNARHESQRLGLVVQTAEELLEQLTTSQRIVDDIGRYLKSPKTPLCVIVRPWVLIPHSLEFRAFVHKRQLTAVSAYYRSELYPFLSPYKQAILRSIVQFFQQSLEHQLPMENSVLDLGLMLADSDRLYLTQQETCQRLSQGKYRVVLIEINPFGKVSGSALFSWLQPVLTKGPLEFRLTHQQTFS